MNNLKNIKKKFYSDGLIIKTSLNSKLQKIANNSLLNGLIDYDKRHGWRGSLGKDEVSSAKIKNYILKFTNPFPNKWKIVQIKKINKVIPYLKEYLSDRKIVVCREMSKIYEEYLRTTVEKLKFFKKGYFQLTQIVWSIQSLNFIFHNQPKPDYIMTRADWILFLLCV